MNDGRTYSDLLFHWHRGELATDHGITLRGEPLAHEVWDRLLPLVRPLASAPTEQIDDVELVLKRTVARLIAAARDPRHRIRVEDVAPWGLFGDGAE